MANEMMYANILAQAHMTAIQAVLKAMDFSSMIVENSVYSLKSGVNPGENAFSTVFIPRDKIDDFKKSCETQDLFYILPGEKYELDGQTYTFIDTDPLSDFIMVRTKAPVLALREDGVPLLDKDGKEYFVPGSDKDLIGISSLANKLNHEYLEEQAALLGKDYSLTSHEANDKWENIDTVIISDLKLSELELLQDRASDLKIGSFAFFDAESGKFALELPAASFDRNPMLPDIMAPAEALIADYTFAKNCPKIKDYMEYSEKRHNELSAAIAQTKEGIFDKDIVVMYTKTAKFDIENDCACPSMGIRLHDQYAEILTPDGLSMEMIDMMDPESAKYVSDLLGKFGKDYLILDTDYYESVVGKWMYMTDNKDNILYNENGDPELGWMPGEDKDRWDRYIGIHINESAGFEELKDDIYNTAAALRDDNKINYQFKDGTDAKMYEARIPESDTVIANTIVTKFEPNLDFVNVEKEKELIKHDIEVANNSLKVSLASHYCETPAFVKKNRTEQLLDESGRDFIHAAPLQSLTPEEFAQYYASLDGLVEGVEFNDIDYGAYDELIRSEHEEYDEEPEYEDDLGYSDFDDNFEDQAEDMGEEMDGEFNLSFDENVW